MCFNQRILQLGKGSNQLLNTPTGKEKIPLGIRARIRKEGERDNCSMCHFWLSEELLGLYPWVDLELILCQTQPLHVAFSECNLSIEASQAIGLLPLQTLISCKLFQLWSNYTKRCQQKFFCIPV